MTTENLYRLAAFTDKPAGGNPAGVWIGESFPEDAAMQAMAKEVGYSETAFITPLEGLSRQVRYFSPELEVPFCGHATIASGVMLGRLYGEGTYQLDTRAGQVAVTVARRGEHMEAALVSVATRQRSLEDPRLQGYLDCFGWSPENLADHTPPMVAYAGAWHLVLAVNSRETLAAMSYDFEALKALMLEDDITTIQVIWRERDNLVHARNPFPVGGVIEDPATGAAAAALGGYLRDGGLIRAPMSFEIVQGEDMGRPGLLRVDVPAAGGIRVAGTAVALN